jgi:hypothetical protein
MLNSKEDPVTTKTKEEIEKTIERYTLTQDQMFAKNSPFQFVISYLNNIISYE